MTLNELRQRGYWIIVGASAVGNLISKCITCRKLRAPPQLQKMADLPKDRTEPVPPFTYSAVDYFGPFFIKEGRKEVVKISTELNSRIKMAAAPGPPLISQGTQTMHSITSFPVALD